MSNPTTNTNTLDDRTHSQRDVGKMIVRSVNVSNVTDVLVGYCSNPNFNLNNEKHMHAELFKKGKTDASLLTLLPIEFENNTDFVSVGQNSRGLVMYTDKRYATIDMVHVRNSYRRRGYASTMIDSLKERLPHGRRISTNAPSCQTLTAAFLYLGCGFMASDNLLESVLPASDNELTMAQNTLVTYTFKKETPTIETEIPRLLFLKAVKKKHTQLTDLCDSQFVFVASLFPECASIWYDTTEQKKQPEEQQLEKRQQYTQQPEKQQQDTQHHEKQHPNTQLQHKPKRRKKLVHKQVSTNNIVCPSCEKQLQNPGRNEKRFCSIGFPSDKTIYIDPRCGSYGRNFIGKSDTYSCMNRKCRKGFGREGFDACSFCIHNL